MREGKRAETTQERWQQVRSLRETGVRLLECARRLSLSLNTVKRYDRASEPERLERVPKYRPTLVDPYRDHLRKRRAEEPAVPIQQLLREIRELGYPGSSNLLVRYISQGRLDGNRPHLSPRRATRLLPTRPDRLTSSQAETLARIEAACPEMRARPASSATSRPSSPRTRGNATRLQEWITSARTADLPHVRAFTRGLDLDIQAATAALTLPFHNGRTEGASTRTKMIKSRCTDEQVHPPPPPHPAPLTKRHHRNRDRAEDCTSPTCVARGCNQNCTPDVHNGSQDPEPHFMEWRTIGHEHAIRTHSAGTKSTPPGCHPRFGAGACADRGCAVLRTRG
jgi:Transposase